LLFEAVEGLAFLHEVDEFVDPFVTMHILLNGLYAYTIKILI
jgi:hypothetical protein